jgi:tetratricopeptide (TPR) repeat protein
MNQRSGDIPTGRKHFVRDVVIIASSLSLVGLVYAMTFVSQTNQAAPADTSGQISAMAGGVERFVSTGNELMDAGRYEQAILHYGQALALDSTLVDVRVDRGSCYFAIEDYQDAITDFAAAIAIEPKHATAHFNLGVVYGALGNDSLMAYYWEKCIESDPEGQLADRIRQVLDQHESGGNGGD